MHFGSEGRLAGCKILAFGLEKRRVARPLGRDERTFHVFYQLLAGASSEERRVFNLNEDVTAYDLLASSGCYRAATGPASNDEEAMGELRTAMSTIGFKARQVAGIWSVLSAILLLNNIRFGEPAFSSAVGEAASIINLPVLQSAAELLGVEHEELLQGLTTRTRLVKKQLVSVLLSAETAGVQRDSLVSNLYATLIAFIVETINHHLARNLDASMHSGKITLLDVAGPQLHQSTRAQGASSESQDTAAFSTHHAFVCNFAAELVQNCILRRAFDGSHPANSTMRLDGVELPDINSGDNSGCIELLRGGATIGGSSVFDRKPSGILGALNELNARVRMGSIAENDGEALVEALDRFASHSSYLPSNRYGRKAFGVNHFQGTSTYSTSSFLRDEYDMLDASLLQLLRDSNASFVAKLLSGPCIAIEPHPLNPTIAGAPQISVRPLRQPSPLSHQTSQTPSPLLDPLKPYSVTRQINSTLSEVLGAVSQADTVWTVLSIRPNDIDQPNSIDAHRISSQVQSLLLADMLARKRCEYVSVLAFEDFCSRYASAGLVQAAAAAGVTEPRDKVQAFVIANAWRESIDYAFGHTRLWLAYSAWRRLEDRLRSLEAADDPSTKPAKPALPRYRSDTTFSKQDLSEYEQSKEQLSPEASEQVPLASLLPSNERDRLLCTTQSRPSLSRSTTGNPFRTPYDEQLASENFLPWTEVQDYHNKSSDYFGNAASTTRNNVVDILEKGGRAAELRDMAAIEEEPTSRLRRWWVGFVWVFTWWIPGCFLSRLGRMKRPDVQMAWREKLTICMLIFLTCAFILFYILVFGRLLCPKMFKAWNTSELTEHASPNSYYVAVRGKVYDLTKFWKLQHSDTTVQSTNALMLQLAGQDLTPYFPVPLTVGCPDLVIDSNIVLTTNASSNYYTPTIQQAVHTSGPTGDQASKLSDINWYPNVFLPRMKKYYKGDFVTSIEDIQKQGGDRTWAIVDGNIYDIGDYAYTNSLNTGDASTKFLPSVITDLFGSQSGSDITSDFKAAMAGLNQTTRDATQTCLDNVFYAGQTDFRDSARCLVQNYLLLAFSIVLVATIVAKFLAALQLTSKGNPEQQNKFVICQVPCYTEGEEELRKTIESIAALQYDDKRKLLFLICDGMIVGNGNELSTPRIVLDILGVDPKIDPEPLMFKSVAEGSKQLNYGKVYSGLYEFEGHVVPYIVVVKVGRPSERSRPGNRGKRDTQILLMRYLNRVHFDAPMYPLELEIFHQMKNVIGIDPAFYEYILMVDADTTVEPEGLNRLVSVAADDSRVIAVCGETRVVNEEGSWWTMIQVYEYYISHHLSKAFESLFGSVTCLPGCFSMYRIRSADKGRPLFISNRIIDGYSENRIDTLHKKNLLALGEDRYLTTLILKNFPAFRTKFTPDAKAQTTAPDKWGILLSQRRRWINSTIHNLAELVLMPELCGFCCFSMRFIVFLDLLGTIILPATTIYLIYLIITVSTTSMQIPYISLAMIGAVYGLQMIIFLLKRQWQYLGWLLIYLLAFPIWSFFLPIYSFWHMDDFSWGNTRIVVGEKGNKKIIAGTDEEPYDDSMLPLKKYSEYQRDIWRQPQSTASGRTSPSTVLEPPASTVLRGNSPHGSSPSISEYGGGGRRSTGGRASVDYYQGTNVLDKSASASRRTSMQPFTNTPSPGEIGHPPSASNMSYGTYPPSPGMGMYVSPPSMYGMPATPMPSMYGMPTPPLMSYPSHMSMASMGGGMLPLAQSFTCSEGGDPFQRAQMSPTQHQRLTTQTTGGSWSPSFPLQEAPEAARSTLRHAAKHQSRASISTMLSTSNPFALADAAATRGQSVLPTKYTPDPTHDEIVNAVQTFLTAQSDLMQVSKRSVREAVIASFPNATAQLQARKAAINQAIDDTLCGPL